MLSTVLAPAGFLKVRINMEQPSYSKWSCSHSIFVFCTDADSDQTPCFDDSDIFSSLLKMHPSSCGWFHIQAPHIMIRHQNATDGVIDCKNKGVVTGEWRLLIIGPL